MENKRVQYGLIIACVICIIVIGMLAYFDVFNFNKLIAENSIDDFCLSQNMSYDYLNMEDFCFEIKNNSIIKYQIIKFNNSWYFIKNGD